MQDRIVVFPKQTPGERAPLYRYALPVPLTPLIGRQQAITAVGTLLRRPVLRLDMVDKSTGPLQTHFGPVFSDEAVQTGLLFPE